MKIDVHQHLWTEPLVEALAARSELPFVRVENGLTVLYLAGERPYVIDLASETARSGAQRSSSATGSTGRSCACRARSGSSGLPASRRWR